MPGRFCRTDHARRAAQQFANGIPHPRDSKAIERSLEFLAGVKSGIREVWRIAIGGEG